MIKHSVEITGSALSFLYFLNSSKANEGLLLGKIESKETEVISDALEHEVKQEKIILINKGISGIFPFDHITQKFLTSEDGLIRNHLNGKVCDSKLQIASEVVGWFCCRRNTQFKPTFRETALHYKLCSEVDQEKAKNFVFALVQDIYDDVNNIHESQAKFLKFSQTEKKWIAVTGSILNLCNKSSAKQESLYRSFPSLEPSLVEMFAQQSIASGLANRELVEGVMTNAHKYLMESIIRVSKLNSEICKLESEITKQGDNRLGKRKLRVGDDESVEDDTPPSPPLGRRLKKVNE